MATKQIKIVSLPVSKIKPNPANPRTIRDAKFKQLVTSLNEFPEMLELRPLILNKDHVILGGNMRFAAGKEAGIKKFPCIIADHLNEHQQKEFIIKDNVSGGEWDFEMLRAEWNIEVVQDWGVDFPKHTVVNFEAAPKEEGLWFLNIECESEKHCQELFERLKSEGLIVKIVQ